MNEHKRDLNNFLSGVSDYFEFYTEEDGVNLCKKHKIEHTGKTVYSIGIDLHLFKTTKDKKYRERVIKRVERVVCLFGEENGTNFFVPTGNPKWNMSNRIIDSGAAVDMLSLVILQKDILNVEDYLLDKVKEVVKKCSDTYLIKNSVAKDHTNQRLWGATGLGTSYLVFGNSLYKKAILDSCERSFSEYRKDGSIPYVTDQDGLKTHPSIVDTTTYYHSRHIAFMSYALDCVDELNENSFSRIEPNIDFLAGMYQANGVKNIRLETKRWYFTSSYEIASHSYDVHAFALGYRYTTNPKYAFYAVESLKQMYKHQIREDGGIDDHIGEGKNFQCPYFWNSHCAWLTRIYDIVDDLFEASKKYQPEHNDWFEESQLLNFKNNNYACLIRGSKKCTDSLWGPSVGGGSLIYFGSKNNDFENIINTSEYGKAQPGNFYIKKFKWNPIKWFNLPLSNIRAHLYHIKIELRAGEYTSALFKIKSLIKKEISFYTYFSSHNCTKTEVVRNADEICFKGYLADFMGNAYSGIKTERSFQVREEGLFVTDKIYSSKNINCLLYKKPAATKITIKPACFYKKTGNIIRVYNQKEIEVKYELR